MGNYRDIDKTMEIYAARPVEDQLGITREATEFISAVHDLLMETLNEDMTNAVFVVSVGALFAAAGIL